MNLKQLLGRTITKIREADFTTHAEGQTDGVIEVTLDNGKVVFLVAYDPVSSRYLTEINIVGQVKVGPDEDYKTQTPWKTVA